MLYTVSESSVGFVLCAAVLQWSPFRDLRLASQPGESHTTYHTMWCNMHTDFCADEGQLRLSKLAAHVQ